MAYNKYQEGKIYRLLSLSRPDLMYIGSTILPLQQRFNVHIRASKLYNQSSKIIIDCGDPYIELLEVFPCENRTELIQRERWFVEHNNCVNYCTPGRTDKECKSDYHRLNKDLIKKQKKKYYSDNKDKIQAQRKEIWLCICGFTYTCHHKARHERTQRHTDFINNPFASIDI
jgi:hypothetical protein